MFDRTNQLSQMKNLVVLALMLVTVTLADEEGPTIITPSGRMKGVYKTSQHGRPFQSYEGIPYAQPPVGKLRFQPPEPIGPWNGELDASKPGAECVQYLFLAYGDTSPSVKGVEDCLYLNVHTPVKREQREDSAKSLVPVIFFIHGGSYNYGSGAQQGKPAYLMNKDIVLVTFNYRLGPLGFLSTEDSVVPGNMGLKDQALALRWVANNIESFGGDPNSVTLFGQSAGGSSVHFHYLSPLSQGLFHRGISLSGTALNCWSMAEASLEKAKKLGAMMDCPTNNNDRLIDCLQSRPATSLMGAIPKFMGWLYNPDVPFGPVVENNSTKPFMNKSPVDIISSGESADLPWITTVVAEEGLYTSAQFITHEQLMRQLDENWETIAPHLLDYNFTIPESEHASVAWKIRKHYLGQEPIDRETTMNLIHLMGDRLYAVDAEKAARFQAEASKSPIRIYFFDYRGEYSLADEYTGGKENFGVSHADDEFYVFPGPGGPVKTKRDILMSEYMVNMWTSFALTGIPDAGIRWAPIDPSKKALSYLHIVGPHRAWMESDDNFGEKKFWNSIHFNENKLAENTTVKNC